MSESKTGDKLQSSFKIFSSVENQPLKIERQGRESRSRGGSPSLTTSMLTETLEKRSEQIFRQ